MSGLYNILNALVKRSKFTYTEVQIPITISGGLSAWAEAAVPTGFIAIEGYYIESIHCSIRNLSYNTQMQKISVCVRNWTSDSVTTTVNVQVSVES